MLNNEMLTIISASLFYAVSSAMLTLTSKRVYTVSRTDLSPMNLLMIQCLFNVVLCTLAIASKELLKFETKLIPSSRGILSKFKLGIQIGLANMATVIFSLFAVKHSSIPMFLAIRRCSILATVIVTFAINGEKPGK